MEPESTLRTTAELFRLLGDATRLKMLHALEGRELCVCDLATVVELSQSAVSHQLRLLRTAGLVKSRRQGKMVWYALDDEHVALLLAQGFGHVNHRSSQ